MTGRTLPYVIIVFSLLLSSRSARADDARATDEAKRAFDLGVQRYTHGDTEGARLAFKESYALLPSLETLRNLGVAEVNTDHCLEALGHLHTYAKDPEASAAFVRNKVPSYLEICNRRVGHLRILALGTDVVTIDGKPVRSLVDPVDVVPGEHTIAVLGKARLQRQVQLAPSEIAFVDMRPSDVAPPAAAPAPESAPSVTTAPAVVPPPAVPDNPVPADSRSFWTPLRVTGVIFAGASVASFVASGVFAANAQSDADKVSAQLSGPGGGSVCLVPASSSCSSFNSARSSESDDHTRSEVFLGAGIGAAVVGAVLFFWPQSHDSTTSHVSVAPLQTGGGVLRFSGDF